MPVIKAALPDYGEVNAQVLQDVILRVERAFRALFRRVQAGETPGYPRFQGRARYHSFTYPQYGGGAVLDGSVLSLSKIGRIPLRLHRRGEKRLKKAQRRVSRRKKGSKRRGKAVALLGRAHPSSKPRQHAPGVG